MAKHASRSHIGRVYDHNEDSVRCIPDFGLYLVADGMGGHASGEVASRIAADAIVEHRGSMPLTDAVRMAHRAVVSAAGDDASRKGMGSTVVAAMLENGNLDVAWVGDSRGYLYRDGALRRITRDHSLVNLLLDRKEVTEAEAHRHPQKNVITQTLGHGDPTPSQTTLTLRRGDRVLLCSDGLNDELTDADIGEVLADGLDLDAAVATLVDQALAKGGRDNISAVLIECEAADVASVFVRVRSASWWPALLGIGMAVVAASVVLVMKSMGWF
ncbi:MAG: serine/threonine-protein phosphatase [Gammaproteobacteria bacterium]|nr:serine/threonine-protein phosphatase [Gammaproteobacteria bacterium]